MKNNQAGMTLIVKTVTRLTIGLILIYGIYIVLRGHTSPGGGFAGGVIIALSFIHLMLAFGKEEVLKALDLSRGVLLTSVGAIIFLSLSLVGLLGGRRVFDSAKEGFKLLGAGLMPYSDMAMALMVGAGLFVIFLVLVMLAEEKDK